MIKASRTRKKSSKLRRKGPRLYSNRRRTNCSVKLLVLLRRPTGSWRSLLSSLLPIKELLLRTSSVLSILLIGWRSWEQLSINPRSSIAFLCIGSYLFVRRKMGAKCSDFLNIYIIYLVWTYRRTWCDAKLGYNNLDFCGLLQHVFYIFCRTSCIYFFLWQEKLNCVLRDVLSAV